MHVVLYRNTKITDLSDTGSELNENSTNILTCVLVHFIFLLTGFQQHLGESVKRPLPLSPLRPRSGEKGQVDEAICGLEAGHKTASLCAQKPSIITDPLYKCK